MQHFFPSSSLLWGMEQTNYYKYIVMMAKEGSTKIVIFTMILTGILMLEWKGGGCGGWLKLCIIVLLMDTLIAIVLKGC